MVVHTYCRIHWMTALSATVIHILIAAVCIKQNESCQPVCLAKLFYRQNNNMKESRVVIDCVELQKGVMYMGVIRA